MAKKDGMYLYNDWLQPFEKLDRAEVGSLVIAMMRYFIYGEKPPAFQGLAAMAADFIFPQIDRSMEYARLGSRGGTATQEKSRASKKGRSCLKESDTKNDPELTEANERDLSVSPVTDVKINSESATVGSAEEKPMENIANTEQRMFEEMVREDRFNKFWRYYPKKTGKQHARVAFERISPDDSLLKEMIAAIEKQKNSQMWQKEDGRFIPYPANWIDGRRWEDEEAVTVSGNDRTGNFDTDDFFAAALERELQYERVHCQ